VLEEFTLDETVVLARDTYGVLGQSPISLPNNVKLKRYRQEFRTRFCEGLLARRILVAEGATEATSFPVACRRLAEINSEIYSSLEALGICTIDAGADTNIPDLAKLYRGLGKRIFAICDKQTDDQKLLIEGQVDTLFMHDEKGFEDLVVKNTTIDALKRFTNLIVWPQHLREKFPKPEDHPQEALKEYFRWRKADWGVAEFLAQCREDEIPHWLRECCRSLKAICEPKENDTAGAGDGTDKA
jgi:putative ATP-dependent endonuclease of OLD family